MGNVSDILKIAVISFASVWVINKLLDKVNLSQFKA